MWLITLSPLSNESSALECASKAFCPAVLLNTLSRQCFFAIGVADGLCSAGCDCRQGMMDREAPAAPGADYLFLSGHPPARARLQIWPERADHLTPGENLSHYDTVISRARALLFGASVAKSIVVSRSLRQQSAKTNERTTSSLCGKMSVRNGLFYCASLHVNTTTLLCYHTHTKSRR